MIRSLLVLFLGELRLMARQPVTLMVLLLLPVVGTPWTLQLATKRLVGPQGEGSVVGVASREAVSEGEEGPGETAGEPAPLGVTGPDWLQAALRPTDGLAYVPGPAALDPHKVLAEVVETEDGYRIRYHDGLVPGVEAHHRVRQVLRRLHREQVEALLEQAGAPPGADQVLKVRQQKVAIPKTGSQQGLGGILPLVLVLVMVLGASATATSAFTGEKERGTLETLLSAGVDRRAVVLAKVGVSALVTVGMGLVGLLAVVGAQRLGLLPPGLPGGALATRGGGTQAGVVALTVLLGLQVAGGGSVLAAWMPDFKAVSMVSIPATLGLLILGGIGLTPLPLQPLLACVPITNVCLVFRDLLVSSPPTHWTGLAVLAAVAHVGLAAWGAGRLFGREATLLGPDSASARRRLGYHGRDAAVVFVVGLSLLWLLGQMAQTVDLRWGMVFTQVVLVAGVGVGAVGFLGLPLRSTLQLTLPAGRDLALAAVAGLCAPAIGMMVATLQARWLPVPQAFAEAMGRLSLADHAVIVPLLLFAALPALCEELLFRGTLLGLLRRSLPPALRAVAVAAMFGAFHLSVVRFLPTATLGLLLTVVAMRSRSLLPAVVVHFLNNALLLLAIRGEVALDAVHPGVLGVLGLVACGAVWRMGRADRGEVGA